MFSPRWVTISGSGMTRMLITTWMMTNPSDMFQKELDNLQNIANGIDNRNYICLVQTMVLVDIMIAPNFVNSNVRFV